MGGWGLGAGGWGLQNGSSSAGRIFSTLRLRPAAQRAAGSGAAAKNHSSPNVTNQISHKPIHLIQRERSTFAAFAAGGAELFADVAAAP